MPLSLVFGIEHRSTMGHVMLCRHNSVRALVTHAVSRLVFSRYGLVVVAAAP